MSKMVLSWYCPMLMEVLSWYCPMLMEVLSWYCLMLMAVLSWYCQMLMAMLSWYCQMLMAVLSWYCQMLMAVLSWYCPMLLAVLSWYCQMLMAVLSWYCQILMAVLSWYCQMLWQCCPGIVKCWWQCCPGIVKHWWRCPVGVAGTVREPWTGVCQTPVDSFLSWQVQIAALPTTRRCSLVWHHMPKPVCWCHVTPEVWKGVQFNMVELTRSELVFCYGVTTCLNLRLWLIFSQFYVFLLCAYKLYVSWRCNFPIMGWIKYSAFCILYSFLGYLGVSRCVCVCVRACVCVLLLWWWWWWLHQPPPPPYIYICSSATGQSYQPINK